jgi:hypothetical protein
MGEAAGHMARDAGDGDKEDALREEEDGRERRIPTEVHCGQGRNTMAERAVARVSVVFRAYF